MLISQGICGFFIMVSVCTWRMHWDVPHDGLRLHFVTPAHSVLRERFGSGQLVQKGSQHSSSCVLVGQAVQPHLEWELEYAGNLMPGHPVADAPVSSDTNVPYVVDPMHQVNGGRLGGGWSKEGQRQLKTASWVL